MPPATHARCHACPLPCIPPSPHMPAFTMHTPLCHTSPPSTSFAGGNNTISSTITSQNSPIHRVTGFRFNLVTILFCKKAELIDQKLCELKDHYEGSIRFPIIHKIGNVGIFALLNFENKLDGEIKLLQF